MRKILWSFLGAFLFLGMPLWTGAQEEEIPPIVEGDIADMIDDGSGVESNDNLTLVARVELYDSEILSQENNKFKLAFRLVNEGDIQPQIKYAVALTDENDFLIHQKNYDEMITLGAGQELKKEIEYEAPLGLSGKYKLNITAANLKGLPLALGGFGEVSIEGEGLIIFKECYIQIGEDKFSVNDGLDIDAENEKPVLRCEVFNEYPEDITAKVSVQIKERSMFGDEIKKEELEEQVFKAKEKGSLTYNLFLPERPQAYDGEVVLQSEKGTVSATVPLHYVIRGDSATIQNISLDKDDYEFGDTIKINLMVAGDADDFPGARDWTGENQNHKLFADVVVYNGDNQKCAQDKTFEIDETKPINVLELKTDTKCNNPIISLKLRNSEGKILDEGDFNFKTEDEKVSPAGTIKNLANNNLVRLFLALGFILVVATIVTVLIKNKKSSIKILVIFVLFGAFLFFRGESVEAATYTGTGVNAGYSETYVVTYSLNTTQINQGGSVIAYSQVRWYGCLNASRYTVSSFRLNSGGWTSYSSNINGTDHSWAWSVFPTKSITYSNINSVGTNSVYYRVTGRRFFGVWHDGQKSASDGKYTCLRCEQDLSYKPIGTPNAYSCPCYDLIFTSPDLRINFNVIARVNGACNINRARAYSYLETGWAGTSWCTQAPGGITNQPASFLGYGGSATWYCLGSGGGANATCTASRTHNIAQCGTRSTTYPSSTSNFPALTATSWCSRGTAEGVNSITFPAAGTSTPYWICRGSNSGSTGDDKTNCRASRASIPLAKCGPAAKKYTISENNFSGSLCIDGTATPAPSFPGYGGSTSWICKAPLGGIDSPSCSASRSYDYPDVSFSIDPVSSPASPLQVVYDKNESSGFTSANVQLISKIDNFADACGTKGCYCEIDRNLGSFTDFSLKLISSQSSTDVISCGDFSYKLTCLNADGSKDTLTGRSEATVSASVVSKVEDIQTDCTDICGGQKYSKGNTTDHCTYNYTDEISCGLPNCPPVSQPVEVR